MESRCSTRTSCIWKCRLETIICPSHGKSLRDRHACAEENMEHELLVIVFIWQNWQWSINLCMKSTHSIIENMHAYGGEAIPVPTFSTHISRFVCLSITQIKHTRYACSKAGPPPTAQVKVPCIWSVNPTSKSLKIHICS